MVIKLFFSSKIVKNCDRQLQNGNKKLMGTIQNYGQQCYCDTLILDVIVKLKYNAMRNFSSEFLKIPKIVQQHELGRSL